MCQVTQQLTMCVVHRSKALHIPRETDAEWCINIFKAGFIECDRTNEPDITLGAVQMMTFQIFH